VPKVVAIAEASDMMMIMNDDVYDDEYTSTVSITVSVSSTVDVTEKELCQVIEIFLRLLLHFTITVDDRDAVY